MPGSFPGIVFLGRGPFPLSKLNLTLRLSTYYAALFFTIGIALPFWPLFLETRQLEAGDIGLALAIAAWAKIVSVPVFGRLADPPGRGRPTLMLLALLTLLTYVGYGLAEGFWPVVLLQLCLGAFMSPLFPVGDSQVMQAVKSTGVDYGLVRLTGSLSFIGGNLVGGWLIAYSDKSAFHLSLVAFAALILASVWLLPKRPKNAARHEPMRYRALLSCKPFWWLVAAGGALQASHAAFLSMSSLSWKAAGLSESTIAWIWAVSVLGEVAVLALGTRLVARFSPAQLLVAAGLAGLLRWNLNAFFIDPVVLMFSQALHGLTFAATHLATVYLVVRAVPQGLASSGQSLYAAIQSGVVLGAFFWLSGWLFEKGLGLWANLGMAGLSTLGLLLVWRGWKYLEMKAEPAL